MSKILNHHDKCGDGYGHGVMRAVKRQQYLGTQIAHGFAPSCARYLLHLECGHTLDRTESKAHVKCAKCFRCAETSTVRGTP